MSKITLTHESGVTKTVPQGFSWTCFFFGIFVPMIRGDVKWSLITLGIVIIGAGLAFIPNIVWWIVLAVKYNEWYIEDLRMKGFREA